MLNVKDVYTLINLHVSEHVHGVLVKLENEGDTDFTRLPVSEILTRLFVSILSLLASIYEIICYFGSYPLFQMFKSQKS